MRWGEMEILSPSSYFSNSSWFVDDSCWSAARWTPAENKAFENALAVFDENTPDRWHKVAAMVPGKTVGDVIRQYKELEDDVTSIEAGLVPLPGYNATSSSSSISSSSSPFTLEWGGGGHSYRYAGFKQSYGAVGGGRRSSSSVRPPNEHERKKGVPWTEEEHKLFLLGLKKYGKGDWRNISRNFVITRTPTQVASHAQKYFIRQLSGGKDKRRASIHDITTLNLNDNNHTPSPDNNKTQSNFDVAVENHTSKDTTAMGFCSSPYNINSYGLKINGQHQFQRDAMHETSPYVGSQNVVFQMQPGLHYPNA